MNDGTAVGWRTTTVAKTLDLDADGVYGTDGYVMYLTDTVGNSNGGTVPSGINPLTYSLANGIQTRSSIPSYLTLSNNGQNYGAASYGYRQADDPTLSPGPAVANLESGFAGRGGITQGTEVSLLDITANAGIGLDTLRIGFIIKDSGASTGDTIQGIRLTQTAGLGSGSDSVSTLGTGTDFSFYFFDIESPRAGDKFTLYMNRSAGASGNANVIYNGLSFDSIVPEPSTLAMLLGLGGIGLLGWIRRRRRS